MKKKLLSIAALLCITFSLSALPGFTSFIPDNAGEYVYYRDTTFNRESYIGILMYDESSFQIRYIAPQNDTDKLPAKEIALLFTINPKSDFWDMTGENILSTLLPDSDDTDIVNYLHDILYEFSARRIKAGEIQTDKKDISDSYNQFGGNVHIIYDARIPLFNIRTILNEKGQKVFDCVTIGTIKSSEDTTFSDFSGITKNTTTVKKETRKAAKSKTYSYENRSVTLDETWNQELENCWTLGNESLITMSTLPKASDDKTLNDLFIIRKLLESSEGYYVDFQNCEISYQQSKDSWKIITTSFFPEKNTYIFMTKLLNRNKEGNFDYFSMSTFQTAYQKTPAYFDKIVKSYK